MGVGDKPLRVAVWGAGSIGQRHYSILERRPDVEVVAIPARGGRSAELRQQGVCSVDTLDEAVEWGASAVLIATDSGRHEQDVLAAIAAGCDVLVEKPMATDAAAARRMIDAADDEDVHLHVASCLRFDDGLEWVRERVGKIGEIVLADIECLSWLPDWRGDCDYRAGYAARPKEGGVVLDLIHEVDYANWILGPLDLSASELNNLGILGLPNDVEETAVLLATRASSRAPIVIHLSYVSKHESRNCRILGSMGKLTWDYHAGIASILTSDGAEIDRLEWESGAPMYEKQIDAWLMTLRGESQDRLSTALEGLEALTVCDRARAAYGDRLAES